MNTYLENQVLNLLRAVNITAPTTVYLSLHTADVGQSGSLANEIATSTGYARQAITFGTAASGGSIANTADVVFPAATAAYTVAAVAIVDSPTQGAGNCLWHSNLTASKSLAVGDTFKMPSGQLNVSIS